MCDCLLTWLLQQPRNVLDFGSGPDPSSEGIPDGTGWAELSGDFGCDAAAGALDLEVLTVVDLLLTSAAVVVVDAAESPERGVMLLPLLLLP